MLIAAGLSGCASIEMGHLESITVPDQAHPEMDTAHQSTKRVILENGRLQGTHGNNIYVFVPAGHPNIEYAVRTALGPEASRTLKDVQVTYKFWWIPFIFGKECITVEGRA